MQAGDRRIGAERALHVVLAEGDAGLPQVLGVGAQDRDLAPGKPRPQHQPVQPVALQRAGPQLVDRLDKARSDARRDRPPTCRWSRRSAPAGPRPRRRARAAGTALRSAPAARDSRPAAGCRTARSASSGWNRRRVKRCAGAPGSRSRRTPNGWPSRAACNGPRSAIACVGVEAVAIDRRGTSRASGGRRRGPRPRRDAPAGRREAGRSTRSRPRRAPARARRGRASACRWRASFSV